MKDRIDVELIFRKKEERRDQLARLSFEEKIEIVEQLRKLQDDLAGERERYRARMTQINDEHS